MIIFGTRTKVLKNKSVHSVSGVPLFDCKNCGSLKTVQAIQSFKYFHIFWIPFFPFSHHISTQCSHCKKVNYQNEIRPDDLKRIKATIYRKIPWGYYFGLLVIALLCALIILSIILSTVKLNKNIKNPEIGDVYEMKFETQGKRIYTLYRITRITPDSIIFEKNDYETSSVTKLDDIYRLHKNDYSETAGFSKSEMEQMNNEKIINGIIKKE